MRRTALLIKLINYCAQHLADMANAPYSDKYTQERMAEEYRRVIHRAGMHLRGYHGRGIGGCAYWERTFPVGASMVAIVHG